MSEVPSTVKTGDFGLVTISGRGGKLIRLGQWLNGDGYADYEHAFVYIGNGEIVEAEPRGATRTNFHYNPSAVLWSSGHFSLNEPDRAAIRSAAIGYVGTPYSAADYFAIAAHTLHLPHGPALKSYVASSKRMICSQLVDQCYQDAGVHLFNDGRWPGYVTPGDLYMLLQGRR